jgi:hypothetical protein
LSLIYGLVLLPRASQSPDIPRLREQSFSGFLNSLVFQETAPKHEADPQYQLTSTLEVLQNQSRSMPEFALRAFQAYPQDQLTATLEVLQNQKQEYSRIRTPSLQIQSFRNGRSQIVLCDWSYGVFVFHLTVAPGNQP